MTLENYHSQQDIINKQAKKIIKLERELKELQFKCEGLFSDRMKLRHKLSDKWR